MKRTVPLILTFLLLTPLASAQQVDFQAEGECQEYNVTVLAENLEPGIYGVKVDVHSNGQRAGEIYDPVEGWKSSMYYVNGALEVEKRNNETRGNATVEIFADSKENVTMLAKVRKNEHTKWESEERTIPQDCPEQEPLDPAQFFLATLTALLLILLGVTVYKKNLL
ncbi:MAG: hypothetical protein ACLFTQ_04265 [Candidatus Aenigmatarchaeota archaeon]